MKTDWTVSITSVILYIAILLTQDIGIAKADFCPNVTVRASLKPDWKYTIKSPNYPGLYPANTVCKWRIIKPKAAAEIIVRMDRFEVEPSSDCDKDFFTSGSSQASVDLQKKGKCSLLSENYISSLSAYEHLSNGQLGYQGYGNSDLWLKFQSDNTSQFRGFEGQVLVISSENRKCRNFLNGASGSFTSPKYPSVYPKNTKCSWILSVPTGFRVKLKFTAFELESTKNDEGDCANDYVELRNGTNPYGKMLGRYCGRTVPPELYSYSNLMWVLFQSNNNATTNYKGFRAEFVNGSGMMTSHAAFWMLMTLITAMFAL